MSCEVTFTPQIEVAKTPVLVGCFAVEAKGNKISDLMAQHANGLERRMPHILRIGKRLQSNLSLETLNRLSSELLD
jgi:hypothetical protein